MPEPTVIALTPGEPAGIGPDLCVLLAQLPCDDCLVIIGDEQVLQQRAQSLGLPLVLQPWRGREQAGKGLYIETLPAAQSVTAGQLNPANAPYVLHTLERAAAAMNCELVYAIVPRTSLDDIVKERSREKARQLLMTVGHHSRLENQAVSEPELEEQVEQMAADLIDRRGLWRDQA